MVTKALFKKTFCSYTGTVYTVRSTIGFASNSWAFCSLFSWHSEFFMEVHCRTLDRSCQYAVSPADGRVGR